jgi:short-subunit dehydrogenase
MQLANRRCLLTGASGGIGRAVARELSRRKVDLVLSGRNERALVELATELRLIGGRVEVICGDLLSPSGPRDIVTRTLASDPVLDMVVNCAGAMHFGNFETTPDDALDRIWRTNVLAPMRLTQAVLPALRRRREALIVNVGSIFGSIGFPCFATYSASKFALRGFSEALRRELDGSGVQLLYFAPRYTRTALNAGAVERMAQAVKMHEDSPESVALQLAQAIEQRAKDRYLGWPEKFFVRLNSLFPRLVDGALIKQAAQMRPYALQSLPES